MTSSGLFIIVNLLFLCLGAALISYAQSTGFELPVDVNGHVMGDKIQAFSCGTTNIDMIDKY